MLENAPVIEPRNKLHDNARIILSIIGALLLFLFAIDLMVSSLQHLGRNVAETILLAIANPFNGLFIGLLITAMLQSSSTTTALVVAMVASNSITLESAVPIIMGANVGTTITSTIVSLGFINKKKEFRRAVTAGTYHDFFNILTVIVLFPLEFYYGFLSNLSSSIAAYFFTESVQSVEAVPKVSIGIGSITRFLLDVIPSPFILVIVGVALLFISILIFRKIISDLLKAKSPEVFSRFFFKSQIKSFAWGMLTTAAIRSSTITTSIVVPIVAKRIASIKQAAPFIMGANIGTTITAFIAAMINSNTSSAISIAIAHFLFNFIGVILFFPIPVLRRLPIELANHLGRLTLRYRLVGFVYILSTFFFIPFTLIYFNQHPVQTLNLTYEQADTVGKKSYYRVRALMQAQTQQGEWARFEGLDQQANETPSLIFPVYVKNETLFIGNQMVLFNREGFCWDQQTADVKYKACIEKVLPALQFAGNQFESVYVYSFKPAQSVDSTYHRYYYSGLYKILLQHELVKRDSIKVLEKLIKFEKR